MIMFLTVLCISFVFPLITVLVVENNVREAGEYEKQRCDNIIKGAKTIEEAMMRIDSGERL